MRKVRGGLPRVGIVPALGTPPWGTTGGGKTGLAAASYTIVAAAQKASGFILLILFTHILTPTEYGQVALLTTIGALLAMVLSLGLEPRIVYAYFKAGPELPGYLRQAGRVSAAVPVLVAAVAVAAICTTPVGQKPAWVMECLGACLLAAGTTYPFAVLRAARKVGPYATLALSILAAQVVTRVVMVGFLDWGANGWAASDLASGLVAAAVGWWTVGSHASPDRAPGTVSPWRVVRDGLPLIPHYLAQWGLALSDRLILAFFVATAAVGYYSAMYQIAAVTSLVLNEINRAFMPLYAKRAPQAAELPELISNHLRVTFVVHASFVLFGFAAIQLALPAEYRARQDMYPLLALGALAYGLYFLPMNGLTLVAGKTSGAPIISMSAFLVNVALNILLDSLWGLWGAVVATILGYTALAALAFAFEVRSRALPWRAVLSREPTLFFAYIGIIIATVTATGSGILRVMSLFALATLVAAIAVSTLRRRNNWQPRST